MVPFVELSPTSNDVVGPDELMQLRVLLEVPLQVAASALGLSVKTYAALERSQLFFKDEDQWKKTKALLRSAMASDV